MNTLFGNSSSINSSIVNKYQPVAEAYIGKTAYLEAIEKEFDIIIKDYNKDSGMDLNKHHSSIAISKLLQQQFGFAESKISWSTNHLPNAFTMGCSLIKINSHEKSFKLDKSKGYYDVDHCISSVVFFHIGLLTNVYTTGGTLTAFLLHEIGHEFDNSPYLYLDSVFGLLTNPLQAIIIEFYKQTGVIQDSMNFWNSLLSKNSNVNNFFQSLSVINAITEQIFGIFKKINLIGRIASGSTKIIRNPINVISDIFGSPGEFHSDEVAAMYGYGEEFTTGLRFLRNTDAMLTTHADKNILTAFAYDTFQQSLSLVLFMANPLASMECHPTEQARIKNNIRKLQKDLKQQDYPPKMKEQLISDIENTEKLYEDFCKCQNGEKGKIFSMVMRQFNEVIVGGKSWHNLVPRNHI